jgi:hypothetical protein
VTKWILLLALSAPLTAYSENPIEEQNRAKPLTPRAREAIRKRDLVRAAVELRPKEKDGTFYSFVPLGGYNPTYGFFFGGGVFRKWVEGGEPQSNYSFVGIYAQEKASKFEWRWEKKLGTKWMVTGRNEFALGFESNYGRGNETLTADRVDVLLWKDELEILFPRDFGHQLSIGPTLEHRARRNRRMEAAELARQRDPVPHEEFTVAVGIQEMIDYRNIPGNPSLGWKQGFKALVTFPYVGPIREPFYTLDADVAVFQYLLDKELVLAHSLAGGIIFGTPTFLNEFRLGGTDRLRGFFYNRFRGSLYYVEQTELRFPIWRWVSGASFLEFGEATEKHFGRAHVSYGGGLRIGLPPDNVSKIRIDYAMSRDQQGVFVDFGHSF